MSDDNITRFKPQGKLEQLTKADLKKLTPEEIDNARKLGHLDELLGRTPPAAQTPPAEAPPNPLIKKLAEDLLRGKS